MTLGDLRNQEMQIKYAAGMGVVLIDIQFVIVLQIAGTILS